MYKVLVFAGTTEGFAVSEFLSDHRVPVLACVATEYGSRSLKETKYLSVRAGRLDPEQMERLMKEETPQMVLDATHPYAAEVTVNIKKACEASGCSYVRVLRKEGSHQEKAVYVESTQAAVAYLEQTQGNILLTTGSKELSAYTALTDYRERLYARVLSLPSVLETCREYGFEGRHLIGMQGPFSQELNAAMLRQYDCAYLVTKDTGKAGGFQEKIDAAVSCGVTPVIIGRPLKEEGLSLMECKHMLAQTFDLKLEPKVTLLGIGMDGQKTITVQGRRAVREADLIIGARRMVDSVRMEGQDVFYEYRSDVICRYIKEHPEYDRIVVALSGDVGFYSGAKKLLDQLGKKTEILCGISSVVYFLSKIGMSWDDAKIVSAHGRNCNLISLIRHHKKVFSILGTTDGVARLAGKLVTYGMGDVILYVGENLAYDGEKIFSAPARELVDYIGDALSVVLAYHEAAIPRRETHGISDEEFIRGKAPMTKEEVRSVSLSKLRLREDSVCYDVGAGTGSVSVEMALRAHQGMVYAIEKKEDAAVLLEENKHKFGTDNLEIIRGEAPSALEELPVPTHAFIGGSSGNLKQIVELLLGKNPQVRMVINCITLETVSEALEVMKQWKFSDTEIVQLAASRSKKIGRYNLMMGENPIYIITCQNPESGSEEGALS